MHFHLDIHNSPFSLIRASYPVLLFLATLFSRSEQDSIFTLHISGRCVQRVNLDLAITTLVPLVACDLFLSSISYHDRHVNSFT